MYGTILAIMALIVAHTKFVYAKGMKHFPITSKESWEVFDIAHEFLPNWSEHGWWLNSIIPATLLAYLAAYGQTGSLSEIGRAHV